MAMHLSLELNDHDKLVVLSTCLVVTLVALVLLVCKIFPCCPLHKFCPCGSNAGHKFEEGVHPQSKAGYNNIEDAPNLDERPYGTNCGKTPGPLITPAPTIQVANLERILVPGASMPKYCADDMPSNPSPSPFSKSGGRGNSQKSNQSRDSVFSTNSDTPASERGSISDDSKSTIEFALQFDEEDDKLAIYLIACRNLPCSLYGTVPDSFVRIVLVRDMKKGWFSRKNSLSLQDLTRPESGYDTVEVQSNVLRRNLNPNFNEVHVVKLTTKEKKNSGLKIATYQIDKFGRHLLVGECHAYLDKEGPLEIQKAFVKVLKQNLPSLGEVNLTLNYLPTAERLCVTVEKATGLKLPDSKNDGVVLNPFIKVSLVTRGKVFERHKTSALLGTTSPEFKQLMNFDLPPAELDKVTVIVTAMHQAIDTDRKASCSQDSSGSSEDRDSGTCANSSIKSRRKSASNLQELTNTLDVGSCVGKTRSSESVHVKAIVIGRLALGQHVTGTGRNAWMEMVANPRTPSTSSHKLIP